MKNLLFPRKISTFKSNNKQFLVRSRQEIIDSFIDSNFVDCRINAYPYLTDYKGIPRYKPNFLFIDLDKNNFKTNRSFELALYNTLKNIKEKLEGTPTVLETGGGYHIYKPVDIPTALENIKNLMDLIDLQNNFLDLLKIIYQIEKQTKIIILLLNHVLLRIPGSINSKYNTKVKIVKKWNGIRAPVTRDFLEEFRTWLIQKKIDQQKQRQKILVERSKNKFVGIK